MKGWRRSLIHQQKRGVQAVCCLAWSEAPSRTEQNSASLPDFQNPELKVECLLTYLNSTPLLIGPMQAVWPLESFDKQVVFGHMEVACTSSSGWSIESANKCTNHCLLLVSLQIAVRSSHSPLRPSCMLYYLWIMVSRTLHRNKTALSCNWILASCMWQKKTTDWDELLEVRAPLESGYHWFWYFTRYKILHEHNMCKSGDRAWCVIDGRWLQSSFISTKDISFSPDQVSARFKIPALMFDRTCLESNGFCGRKLVLDSDGQLEVYSKFWSWILV